MASKASRRAVEEEDLANVEFETSEDVDVSLGSIYSWCSLECALIGEEPGFIPFFGNLEITILQNMSIFLLKHGLNSKISLLFFYTFSYIIHTT